MTTVAHANGNYSNQSDVQIIHRPSPLHVVTTCAADIASVRLAGSVNPVAVSLDDTRTDSATDDL